MTVPELEAEYERALRREKAGVHDEKNALLSDELVRRSTQVPEVGLC